MKFNVNWKVTETGDRVIDAVVASGHVIKEGASESDIKNELEILLRRTFSEYTISTTREYDVNITRI